MCFVTTHMTVRVDYSDNRAVRRRVFALERKARFLSPAPENQFTNAGAGRINRHQGFSLRSQILVEGLHDEQLPVMKRFVLHRCDHRADYPCELHKTQSNQVWSAESGAEVQSIFSTPPCRLQTSDFFRTHN